MICVGLDLAHWDNVKEAIEHSLAGNGGRNTSADMLEAIKTNKVQLWAIHDGAIHAVMTTEIIQYQQFSAVRIITVTGSDSEQWLDLLIETIGAWGKENGASAIEFVGRIGWEKVLTKRGFGGKQIFMTKQI